MLNNRLIGEYTGNERGPLLICFGGIHGNEPAGVKALEHLFKLLDEEPTRNPNFTFKGKFVGFRGNTKGLEQKSRFIDRDLNRLWTAEHIHYVRQADKAKLNTEDRELRALAIAVEQQIQQYQPHQIVLLDLHTTSAKGGIFSIVSNDPESERIGIALRAPVIRGMQEGMYGTTIHYFNNHNIGIRTVSILFEAGQHDEPESVDNAVSAIIECMGAIGCVHREHIEDKHDEILLGHSKNLPKLAKLLYRHPIYPGDGFEMRPGYRNFQPVHKGELLAKDRTGEIYSDYDGLILMPLYQTYGEDGFFIIRKLERS